jgi:hypothetical protein
MRVGEPRVLKNEPLTASAEEAGQAFSREVGVLWGRSRLYSPDWRRVPRKAETLRGRKGPEGFDCLIWLHQVNAGCKPAELDRPE